MKMLGAKLLEAFFDNTDISPTPPFWMSDAKAQMP